MAVSLELLHPSHLIAQRKWTFETESVIRIGREVESNQVVLDDPLVSRFHVMLWSFGKDWKIVNLSCHGTYLDNQPITSALLTNGAIIRLSPDGPQLRFRRLVSSSTLTQHRVSGDASSATILLNRANS